MADHLAAMLDDAERRFHARDYDGAGKLILQALRIAPNDRRALKGIAALLVIQGQIDDAIQIHDHLVAQDPNDLDARGALVNLFFQCRRYDQTIGHVDILIDQDPTNPQWYTVGAYAYHNARDLEKARYYIDLGMKNASRGIDFQSTIRHVLPDDLRKALRRADGEDAKAFTRDVLRRKRAAVTWTAEPGEKGRTRLRGVTKGLAGGWRVSFEISPVDAGGGKPAIVAGESTGKPDRGVSHWSAVVNGLAAGGTYACRMTASKGARSIDGGETRFTTPLPAAPTVETTLATPVGTTGASVNGSVWGTTLPTRYWFAWGSARKRLTNATPRRFLPPGRTLRVRETPHRDLKRWQYYALDVQIRPAPRSDAEGPPHDYVTRMIAPFGKDRNHLSGVGVAELVWGWDSTAQPLPNLRHRHPGDSLDFRDAEVEMVLGFPDLDAKDYLMCFWLHTYTGTSTPQTGANDAAPWALTGQAVDTSALVGTGPHTLRFTLPCRTDAWTFAGNNVAEQGDSAHRYTYYPLHDTLADHRGNTVIIFLFGQERDLPEGSFDVATASLRCRNASLLAPGTPARLTEWPRSSWFDPAELVNGWIGSRDHFWFSGSTPKRPQEFVWDLGRVSPVRFLRLRQNPLYPAKRVEVWGAKSRKGKFKRLWDTVLPAKPPEKVRDDPATIAILDSPAPVRFLKLRIVTGHKTAFWGLDAFEAFGDDAESHPEREPSTLCEDIADLPPGGKIYYRLVAENAAGRSKGDIRSFAVPADQRPIIHDAKVFRHDAGKTTVMVRMTAMGLPTTLTGQARDGAGKKLDCPPRDAGSEKTPRHITCTVAGARPGRRCRLTLTARNGAGKSTPVAVDWNAPE